jgi:hypothetical protein
MLDEGGVSPFFLVRIEPPDPDAHRIEWNALISRDRFIAMSDDDIRALLNGVTFTNVTRPDHGTSDYRHLHYNPTMNAWENI